MVVALKTLSLMVLLNLGIHTSLGHDTAEMLDLKAREGMDITIKDKFYHRSVLVLDSSVVRPPTCKAVYPC